MYWHVQRIRDFFGNALYKFTFYLLTYLLTNVRWAKLSHVMFLRDV